MGKPFSITARLKSFKYAFQGIWLLIKEEHNFRIHLAATAMVVILGLYFRVSQMEWLWLILSVGLVLSTEAINSAVERLVDLREPEQNTKAGKIKDIAAGAVLLSAIAAAIIGVLIFWPYFSQAIFTK